MRFMASAAIFLIAIGAAGQMRPDGGPMPGERAPDFTLNTSDGARSLTLSELEGRPTVLVFASYT